FRRFNFVGSGRSGASSPASLSTSARSLGLTKPHDCASQITCAAISLFLILYHPSRLSLERGFGGLEGLLRLPGLPCLLLLRAVNIREAVDRFRRLEYVDLEHGALLAVLLILALL